MYTCTFYSQLHLIVQQGFDNLVTALLLCCHRVVTTLLDYYQVDYEVLIDLLTTELQSVHVFNCTFSFANWQIASPTRCTYQF